MKILLVEDDITLAMGIEYSLKNEGFNVIVASSLEKAREDYYTQDIDMILLDVTLPDGSGYDFCKEVRERYETSIIFLTEGCSIGEQIT